MLTTAGTVPDHEILIFRSNPDISDIRECPICNSLSAKGHVGSVQKSDFVLNLTLSYNCVNKARMGQLLSLP